MKVNNRRIFLVMGAILAAFAMLAAACATTPTPTPTSSTGTTNTTGVVPGSSVLSVAYPSGQQVGLWVSGEGKVMGVPDIAVLQLGVEAQDTTVAAAQQKASQAMGAITAALTAKGVASKDIQTQQFSITPVMQGPDKDGRVQIVGYRVSNMVTVKIRKLSDAGTIIDAVAAAGGDFTRISSIYFTIEDPSPLQKQARELAIKEAMAKAQQMATVAGVKLGKLVYMTEGGGYVPMPVPYFKGVAEAGSVVTPVSPGELQISVNVQMVFALD